MNKLNKINLTKSILGKITLITSSMLLLFPIVTILILRFNANLTTSLIYAFAILAVLIVLNFFLLKALIVKPLFKLVECTRAVVAGDINVDIDIKSQDEIGLLANEMTELLNGNKEKSILLRKIADGHFDEIKPVPTQDAVLQSIYTVVENFNNFGEEIDSVNHSIESGSFDTRVQTSKYHGQYKSILEHFNGTLANFTAKLDTIPNPICITDRDGNLKWVNAVTQNMFAVSKSDIIGKNFYSVFTTEGSDSALIKDVVNSNKLQRTDTVYKGRQLSIIGSPLVDKQNRVIGTLIFGIDQTEIKGAQSKLEKIFNVQALEVEQLIYNIKKLAKGNFNLDFKQISYDMDTQEIKNTFEEINSNLIASTNLIKKYISDITNTLNNIANANLDIEVKDEYIGEFSEIKTALNQIIDAQNAITTNIITTSEIVVSSSELLTNNAQNLSAGATQQAAAIEEISATITHVAEQAIQTSNKVNDVNKVALESKESALMCDNLMQRLTTSMDEINDASEEISKILKMINDISFQTNILSLNAAVEAARAGAHGKGFAVIAEDVRNLALKSSKAAEETSDMISQIKHKIDEGNKITNKTAESLLEILDGANKVVKLTQDVSKASSEQSVAVQQISTSLEQITEVVHSTSTLAQEGAMSSKQLTNNAVELQAIFSKHKLKNGSKKIDRNVEFKPKEVKSNKDIVISLDDYDFIKY